MIKSILASFKGCNTAKQPDVLKGLTDALVDCFHLPIQVTGVAVISELFDFDLADFLKKHAIGDDASQTLVTEILYGLYYSDINPAVYVGCFEFLVVQILALHLSVKGIIQSYPEKKSLQFLSFLFKQPREGTFRCIKEFDSRFQSLIAGLKSHYYDADVLAETLDDRQVKDHAIAKTKELYTSFHELVDVLHISMHHLFEGIFAAAETENQRQSVKVQQQLSLKGFEPFYAYKYTEEDFGVFAKIFGLKAYPTIYHQAINENSCIVAKVQNLLKLLSGMQGLSLTLLSMRNEELRSILSFVFNIISHLEATIHKKSVYQDGVSLFTTCIATCGKDLSKECALQSVLGGYTALEKFLAAPLNKNPVVVFDQSEDALYKKNSDYISQLNGHVIHVSKSEAEALATKLGVKNLIVTAPNGSFGFGGARNCQFFLTGVIQQAIRAGCKDVSEILLLPQSSLTTFMKKATFGTSNSMGDFIFMVDDDMYVSLSNIFTCALYAKECQNDLVGCGGYQYGRGSKYNLSFWNLSDILAGKDHEKLFPEWVTVQTLADISESLIRPKFCINVPMGNEENNFITISRGHSFLQPAYHLCGSRYPKRAIPTHFFVGLDTCFKKSLPYVLLLYLSEYFISSTSRHVPTTLPWNDNYTRPDKQYMSLKQTCQEMREQEVAARFWKKVHDFFILEKEEYHRFLRIKNQLAALDVEAVLTDFTKKNQLTEPEMASLTSLGEVYKSAQKDMELFWKLGSALTPTQVLEDVFPSNLEGYPLTEGLYLLAKSLGKGEFCSLIKQIN
ncbi:MAG: hypothetical protein LLF94_09295 [Chlamydiales bacterium]|nr:hypothetical protein [Chlamydiales bacterium]